MNWRFTLINTAGVATVIDEPTGWVNQVLELKRDANYHGIDFLYSDDFTYDTKAAMLIREDKKQYGVEANMVIVIEGECNNVYQEAYRGRLKFKEYDTSYGDDCEVKIPTDETSDIVNFKNRIDQKVNLESLTSFGGFAMTPYPALGAYKSVPSKSIFVQDHANRKVLRGDIYQGDHSGGGATFTFPQYTVFVPAMEVTISEEIGGFSYPVDNVTPEYEIPVDGTTPITDWSLPYELIVGGGYNYVDLDRITPLVNYDKTLGKYHGPLLNLTFDINIGFANINQLYHLGNPVTSGLTSYAYFCCIRHSDDTITWLSTNPAIWAKIHHNAGDPPTTGLVNTAFTQTLHIDLAEGDRLYFFVMFTSQKYQTEITQAAFLITNGANNYLKLSGLSTAPATDTKFFFVNEALSRIAESITDNKLRVYSDYFGRSDSMPYNRTGDGCGSLEALTTGLFLRRIEINRPITPPIISLSFKDMLNGLVPIHNIGLGIEPDTSRAGYNRVRVEPFDFFYKEGIGFECRNIDKIQVKVKGQEHYSVIKFGYDKYEAEEYNGIDEYMTRREYRSLLTQVNNTFEQVSTFIASPFATEITRRVGNETSEDWRYDKDIFILCFKRDGGNIVVEQGNVSSPSNIVDPNTTFNYRISPVRNIIRWLPIILASYANAGYSSKIVFTDGEGNFYASGKMSSTFCNNENAVISEKGDISANLLTNKDKALPIWELDSIVYNYPCTLSEWNIIKANKYYVVLFETNGFEGTGWIDLVRYKPSQGLVEFTLRPKID